MLVAAAVAAGVPWTRTTGAADGLDAILTKVAPETRKWASVVRVTGPRSDPAFAWHHYRDSATAVDFWPASVVKVYTVVAALESINALGVDTDSVLTFEHKTEKRWVLDCARTMPEMISEVFRRSSNEDYTLLLRFVGIDRLNSGFLIPGRGFARTALMRGYIRERPYVYVRTEPQRITVRSHTQPEHVVEHRWSGTSYSERRGATVISAKTGNCSSTRDMAECLRRIMYHEHLPPEARYALTERQLHLLRDAPDGLVGLENRSAGAFAWNDAVERVFPHARYYHKGGQISTHTLDLAYVDDVQSGARFILALAAESGEPDAIRAMAREIAVWIRSDSEAR